MKCYITKREERTTQFFKDIHYLDVDMYSKEYAGSLKSMINRNVDADIIIVVKDKENIVGYMDILSLKKEVFEKIIHSNQIIDDEVCRRDLKPLDDENYLYILSIVIKKEYQMGKQLN